MSAELLQDVGIVGFGNSARALACWLTREGYRVHLLVRALERFKWFEETRHLRAVGAVEGTFLIESITDDAAAFLRRVGTVFIATVATAYGEVGERLAPHLAADRHGVVLFSSKLAGSVEFAHTLRRSRVHEVAVLETDALFACRIQEDQSIWVRGFKRWTLYSAPRATETARDAHHLTRFFPSLEPAQNVIQRGLTDFGALAHATTMLANMNAIDRGERFLFYLDGFTPQTVVVLEEVEREFHALARAYNTCLLPMKLLLDRYYGCDPTSLLGAMRSVPNYRLSYAPTTLDHRYLREDVGCTLVAVQQLARKALVPVPTIDAVVHLASLLTRTDLVASGRTLDRLGWAQMSHAEILRWVEG